MRLELNFQLTKSELPLDYRRSIVSFFKNALKLYNEDVFKIVYDVGQEKNMSFAPFMSPREFTKEKIILNNENIKIIFSTEDELLGLHFFNAFLGILNKPYSISTTTFNLFRVKKIKEKEINDEVIFKILSPIIIRERIDDKKSWYHSFDEKGLSILKRNLLSTLDNKFPKKYLEDINIIPLESKKTITSFYGIKMLGNLGVIKITGKKEILTSLYKGGTLSSRKSMGFGLLEVLE